MNYVALYFGLAAVAYLLAVLFPSVFGKTHELFDSLFYEPRIGIPAILFWPATLVIGFTLQRLKLHPTYPAAEDMRTSRSTRRTKSKDVIVPTPTEEQREVLGKAKCITDLRPTGKVEFNGQIVQATALDQHIKKDNVVLVIEIRENELVVVREGTSN